LNYPALIKLLSVIALTLLNTPGSSRAAAGQTYYYLQEPVAKESRDSCASIFDTIHAGKEEDAGGVVRSLKSINVAYLLDDYDNVLTSDRRKQNYLTYAGLLKEVSALKRELYCRIELALYMEQDAAFAGPVYDGLVSEAMQELDTVYTSAKSSYDKEQFERAAYAFDLIAPYRDSYEMFIAAAEHLKEGKAPEAATVEGKTGRQIIGAADSEPGLVPGPILQAFLAEPPAPVLSAPEGRGPISLAVEPGPIVRALHAGK